MPVTDSPSKSQSRLLPMFPQSPANKPAVNSRLDIAFGVSDLRLDDAKGSSPGDPSTGLCADAVPFIPSDIPYTAQTDQTSTQMDPQAADFVPIAPVSSISAPVSSLPLTSQNMAYHQSSAYEVTPEEYSYDGVEMGGTWYPQYSAHTDDIVQSNEMYPNIVYSPYSVFTGAAPHVAHLKPKTLDAPSFFMPDQLKQDILDRQAIAHTEIQGDFTGLPNAVETYRNIIPLEIVTEPSTIARSASLAGLQTTCYKAVSTHDGNTYCLRRIHDFKLTEQPNLLPRIQAWKYIQHPNIVQLKQVFTTKEFGDHSLVFVYDYHPGAMTLAHKHFGYRNNSIVYPLVSQQDNTGHRSEVTHVADLQLWSYVIQLTSALRAVHTAGLAYRSIDPTKILCASKGRLRLNCCGILDVISPLELQTPQSTSWHWQPRDLEHMGHLILQLACINQATMNHNVSRLLEHVAQKYSNDLRNLINYLITAPIPQNRTKTINEVMPMIGARFYTQLDSAHLRNDLLEHEVVKEVENGRLFRLLSKLGTIVDRPGLSVDEKWSETGDRYMLKLFSSYLFHQTDSEGRPWIDLSHIVQSLNKLDSGSEERICISSPGSDNVMLVVSYAELKRCIDSSFGEIVEMTNLSLQQTAAPILNMPNQNYRH